jgi:hypothetical protein
MRKMGSKARCSYCGELIPKRVNSILKHLRDCKEKQAFYTNESEKARYFILLLEDPYSPEYWLVLKAIDTTTLKKLDTFIRAIWVECCGHLSQFHVDGYKIPFTKKVGDIFEKGSKIGYEYDFGTTTELRMRVLDELEDHKTKNDITILLRNIEPEYTCSKCGRKASYICPFCLYEDAGLLCDDCIAKHKCVREEGEDILLPIVNSPRVGMCGYVGYSEKEVKKYFPKDIF